MPEAELNRWMKVETEEKKSEVEVVALGQVAEPPVPIFAVQIDM